ncbi:MAG: alpha/beta hydrolase [Pseudomonadales bacterium]
MPDSAFAVADNYRICYQQYGSGPPIVLVHGWGSDAEHNWLQTGWVDALQPLRTVITIDSRGHGRSDKPYASEPYGYAAMGRDVLAVMDALELTRADFLGYSMGSFIGAALLGQYAHRFTSMMWGGIGAETETSAAQGAVIDAALRLTPDEVEPDSYVDRVRQFVSANPDNDLTALGYSAARMWSEGDPLELIGPDIANLDLPILVVNGTQDFPYVQTVEPLLDALPRVRYEQIPDADHLTAVTDARFKQAVIDFLQSQ